MELRPLFEEQASVLRLRWAEGPRGVFRSAKPSDEEEILVLPEVLMSILPRSVSN